MRFAYLFGIVCLAAIGSMACSSFPVSKAGAIYDAAAFWPEGSGLPDPGESGSYRVTNYLYAGSHNPRRPEYRGPAVAVRTETVDLSPFFTDRPLRLIDNILRSAEYHDRIAERYWGFDASEVPLNASVWYPEGTGPFPVLVVVHGNHNPYRNSEFGYDYLGRHLASHGILFASIDQNFLNGITDGRENDARAALLLYHLHEIVRQGRDPSSPIYGMLDENRLAVMGHSRGGEAAVHAAVFNELGILPDNAAIHFSPQLNIRSVIALAPVEGQYRPAQRALMASDVDFLYLHGSADGDVDNDFASRFLNRPGLSSERFRSGFWIYGANHAYFNSDWVDTVGEFPVPADFRLTPEQQQQLCRVVLTAFLQASFDIEPGYLDFLEDWRIGQHWLPVSIYAARFRSGKDVIIADFSEDADPRSATAMDWQIEATGFSLWKEGKLPSIASGYIFAPEISASMVAHSMHQNTHVVFLRGSEEEMGEYRLQGPPVKASGLRFDIGAHPSSAEVAGTEVADTAEELLDLEIQIYLPDGEVFTTSLLEHASIIPAPATFHLLRVSSRYFAPQTVQIVFPESLSIAGLGFRFPARTDLKWHVDRIALIPEGVY